MTYLGSSLAIVLSIFLYFYSFGLRELHAFSDESRIQDIWVGILLAAGLFYVSYVFWPVRFLSECALILWSVSLIIYIYAVISGGSVSNKYFRESKIQILLNTPGSLYNGVGLFLLTFCIIPLNIFEAYQGAVGGSYPSKQILLGLWALCLLSFVLGARTKARSFAPVKATEKHMDIIPFEDDILLTKAYGYFINSVLENITPNLKVIRDAVAEFLEHNAILFQECILGPENKVDFEPAVRNIERIQKENRIDYISLIFSALSTRIFSLHSAVASTARSEKLFTEGFQATQKTYNRSPLLANILRGLPKGVLEEERLVLLSKKELETRVRERTRELERIKDDQSQLLEELQVAEANLRRVITKNADSIIIVDENREVLFVNPAAEILFRRKAEEWLGNKYEFPLQPKQLMEIEISSEKGKRSIAEVRMVEIEWEAQIAYLASIRDITVRKQTEIELRENRKELEEANLRLSTTLKELKQMQRQIIQEERLRALGQLASGIAHDFNNALSPIVGFTDMLLNHIDLPREKAKKYLTIVNTAASDARNIVSRLREFCRKKDGFDHFQPVYLKDLVLQTVDLTKPKWKDQALGKGVTIKLETHMKFVSPVLGDKTELREALTNLILNAVDAIKDSTGIISIRLYGEDNQGVLEVTDTGVGMTEETKRQCLDPFFSTKDEHGTGLGLSMVYGTIKRHTGSIEIESEQGKGTTIRLRVPVLDHIEREDKERPTASLDKSIQILVVEDDPEIQRLLEMILTLDGHSVSFAGNGREGFKKFQLDHFDLVITDHAMPEMNGDQLASAVKKMSRNKPVLMLTGFADFVDEKGVSSDIDMVIGKPFTVDEIRNALVELIRLPSRESQ